MDKKLLVIAIAVGAMVITTLIQVFMQGREWTPKGKLLVWVTFLAGLAVLIGFSIFFLMR
ncbi:MAG: hypothetical protein RIE53_02190 [Rhodothermales bacterium]